MHGHGLLTGFEPKVTRPFLLATVYDHGHGTGMGAYMYYIGGNGHGDFVIY